MVERGWSRREALAGSVAGLEVLALGSVALPAQAAVSNEADRIDTVVTEFMTAFEIPGVSVTLVRSGGATIARGYGVRRLGARQRVDADTLFAIASNTKAFVSAGIAMLVEAGRLGWDEPVIRYMPDFATSDAYVTGAMTVRDLLCHRSGLPLGAGDLMQFPQSDRKREEFVRGLRYLPFTKGFRSGYAYDNILYVVAGVLIERVTGQSFETFMTTRLLQPLGMSHAVASRDLLQDPNVAARHARLGPPVRRLGRLVVAQPDESTAASPAGGVHASAAEMALWLRTQLALGVTPAGRRLWSEASAREMWTPQVITATGSGPTAADPAASVLAAYALGWNVLDYRGHRLLAHGGALTGQVTATMLLPEQGIGLAVLTNAEDSSIKQLRAALLDIAVGAPAFDWLAAAWQAQEVNLAKVREEAAKGDFTAPPGGLSLPLAAYAGRFRDPWYGDIVVTATGGRLAIDFTRSTGFKSALEPFGPDTFRTRFAPGAGEDAVVTFVVEDRHTNKLKLRALSPLADFSYDFQHLAPRRVNGAGVVAG